MKQTKQPSRFLSILLCVSLPVFAQSADAPTLEEKPEVLRVAEGQVLAQYPDGTTDTVNVGPGLYMNRTMSIFLRKTLSDATDDNKRLVEAVNAARDESAGKVEVKTVVIISAVALGLGLVAGGLIVGIPLAASK